MTTKFPHLSPHMTLAVLISLSAAGGYFLFRQFLGYEWMSPEHAADIVRLKLWSILFPAASVGVIYGLRRWAGSHLLVVFATSVYFIVFFAIQFRGTQFGWNAYWGDNSVILAETCKMMHFHSWLQDWYTKGLPSFYPPGWFALMAVFGRMLHIEAYQTVKFGYLFLFLVYPWALYWLWRKAVSKAAAAAVVVATLFFAYRLLDIGSYEHLAAGLFLPWWLYYFEGASASDKSPLESPTRRLVVGALIGGGLFMIYYYWFFLAVASIPISIALRQQNRLPWPEEMKEIRRKVILLIGVGVISAPYWLPLLVSIVRFGYESNQATWFQIGHTDISGPWNSVTVGSIMVCAGLVAAVMLWDQWKQTRLVVFFAGALALIVVDRFCNLEYFSFQSRKISDFVHVFAAAPLAIAVTNVWGKVTTSRIARQTLAGAGVVFLLITGNQQSQLYNDDAYKIAINSRYPDRQLEPFKSVRTDDAVFLTDRYDAACFVPFYLFVPTGSAGVHPAAQYSQRVSFLDAVSRIDDPSLLAYALAYNRFDSISYFFLPLSAETKFPELTLYQIQFNAPTKSVTFHFHVDPSRSPTFFALKHPDGLYEVTPLPRGPESDKLLAEQFPGVFRYLK